MRTANNNNIKTTTKNKNNVSTSQRCTFENLEGRQLMSAASLDPSFGNGGTITSHLYNMDNVHGMCTQPDGKTLIVEDTPDNGWLVSRRLVNGQLDTQFGHYGYRRISFGDDPTAAGIAVQPNGKIVIVGSAYTGLSDYAVAARLTANGNLDTSFGVNLGNGPGDGVTYAEVDVPTFYGMLKGHASVSGINIRGDGSILIGGTDHLHLAGAGYDDNQMFVLKLQPNGKVDKTFGENGNGVASYNFSANTINAGGDVAHAMAVDSYGRIILAGSADGYMAAFRFTANGHRDFTFGSGGAFEANFPGKVFNFANSLAIAPNGKIVLGGDAFISNVGHEWALMRLNNDGTLDNAFNYTGMRLLNVNNGNDMIKSLGFGVDGKLIAGGTGQITGEDSDFVLGRFNDNGQLDTSFGFFGLTQTDFAKGYDEISQMNITPTGRVTVAGTTFKNGQYITAIARYVGHAPTFSIQAVSTGKEGTSKLPSFKITRDGNPWDGSYDLNFTYSGPATPNVDYTPLTKLHWQQGQSTMIVSLPLKNDKLNVFYKGLVVTLKPDVTYDTGDAMTTIGIYDKA